MGAVLSSMPNQNYGTISQSLWGQNWGQAYSSSSSSSSLRTDRRWRIIVPVLVECPDVVKIACYMQVAIGFAY